MYKMLNFETVLRDENFLMNLFSSLSTVMEVRWEQLSKVVKSAFEIL